MEVDIVNSYIDISIVRVVLFNNTWLLIAWFTHHYKSGNRLRRLENAQWNEWALVERDNHVFSWNM